ncbi:hypothetical protein L227DRAFT_614928 [Lentinus tigrinus ALCF2SS1-6]|uniref:F-box domain-containing protein n=1 Tax=Lentinus tigrinus ALCF2SS1-6 TaxID=1328759 RepID=A0A5C2RYC7_9APHY|nr:hypothetical protein L227DRAFT_614928 [Lentinus tigrinus ALCF2SS1-6]
MARRPAKVRKTKAENCTKVVKSEYRKITDLPPELLHMIFEYFKDERWTMKTCAATCAVLREVTVEHLEYTSPHIHENLDHFMTFMRRHTKPPETVRELNLFTLALDESVMNEIKRLFPKVEILHLEDISCAPPLPYHPPHLAPQPMQLERLVLESYHGGWSLCGMMHILSLLAPKSLVINLVWDKKTKDLQMDKFDPSCLASSPAVEELRVACSYTPDQPPLAELLDALSRTLSPGHLKSVNLTCDLEADVRALDALLRRIGGSNVTSLHLHPHSRGSFSDRQTWSDPFDDWRLLDISACTKLETLYLHIYVKRKENLKSGRAASYFAAGLLANYASPTLRKVTINLHDLECPTTLGNRVVLKLQELDKVVTAARFPNLQQFELVVGVTDELRHKAHYHPDCCEAARRALPGLHARGVLSIFVKLSVW